MSHPLDNATFYHQALIDKLVNEKVIRSPRIEAAFRAVPRHIFLPKLSPAQSYEDRAIPTKIENGQPISSSSQPAMMAIMLEQLNLQPGQRVLEIGAGTGYNAAIMSHLVGESGQVTTLDIDEEIVSQAKQHLAATAVAAPIHVICADGTLGWPHHAPYDRIILTVGGWDISPDWLAQLTANGRLLLPLSLNGPQISVAFDRERENGRLLSQSVAPCGFMRLRGPFAEPEYNLTLGPLPQLLIESLTPLPTPAATLYQWLQAPTQKEITHIVTSPHKIWRDLLAWLALHQPNFCHLIARGEAIKTGLVPPLSQSEGSHRWQSTIGICLQDGLALLAPKPTHTPSQMELLIYGFGPETTAVQQLLAGIKRWEANGRPSINHLSIAAYPLSHNYQTSSNEIIIAKQWQQFVLRWRKR